MIHAIAAIEGAAYLVTLLVLLKLTVDHQSGGPGGMV